MSEQKIEAIPRVQIDDARVRVTEWRVPVGGSTGWHRHEMDYVIVPTVGGKLRIETPDGPVAAEMVAGQSYIRDTGVEHDVINDDDHDIVFIEVELKS